MNDYRTPFAVVLSLLLILVLGTCSAPRPPPPIVHSEPPSPFPVPAGLQPQIDFWQNVFAVWSRGQVALFDNRHLGVVYEVIDLPGPIQAGYTPAQKRLVRSRRDLWKTRLRELERKVAAEETLNYLEQTLLVQIREQAGEAAVRGVAKRLRSQRGLRERFIKGLAISNRYDAAFREIFRQAGLPEELAYLPHVESSFQAHARSSAGAVGMWQFTRGAAQIYMLVHPALDERLDPVASARGAARYLADAYAILGDWALAVTSYNHGINGMKRARYQYGTDFMRIVREYDHRLFGFASRNFYAEFLAARNVAGNPERFFPGEEIRYQAPLDWDRVVLPEAAPASTLARRYGVDKPTLLALNPAWTRAARRDRVALPAGTLVWLPAGTLEVAGEPNEPALALAEEPSSAME